MISIFLVSQHLSGMERFRSNMGMGHSELKWQIRLGNYSWGYNAQIFHFCIPLDFLGAKDFKKISKDRQRSERPNQRPDTGDFKF